ncbi:hypothetical protein KZ779_17175 [Escherichia coli]|nr:hypothetical protein [Escherichia coli]
MKSDLMGEQTILCGMLQAGSLLCFDKLVEEGTDPAYAEKLIQFGWETITEALKQGGITLMMDRLSNPAKLRAYALSEQLKEIMAPPVPETYGRHHLRRILFRYDGGLGQR